MTAVVLDASVTICWCFPDQRTDYTNAVLAAVRDGMAVVPALWAIEIANVLLTCERRGALPMAMLQSFLADLAILPTQVDHQPPETVHGEVLQIAQRHRLTSYDACYLELAKRMQLPIATLDAALVDAAKREKVAVFSADGSAGR